MTELRKMSNSDEDLINENEGNPWEKWDGTRKVCCEGKLMKINPKNWITTLMSYSLLIGYSIYFAAGIAPYTWIKMNPAIVAITIFLFVSSIVNLSICALCDPGVILKGNLPDPTLNKENDGKNQNTDEIEDTRNKFEGANEQPQTSENNTGEGTHPTIKAPLIYNDDRVDHHSKTEEAKKHEINLYKQRYCTTCKIMRPPKASHCSECNCCVKGYDHHCYFIGNCVGIRNLKNFVFFLFFTGALVFLFLGVSLATLIMIINENPKVFDSFEQEKSLGITTLVFLLIAVLCLAFPFHTTIKMFFVFLFVFFCILNSCIVVAKLENINYYENPIFSIIMIIGIFPFMTWVVPLCIYNCHNAMLGMTLKEIIAVKRSVPEENRKVLLKTTCKDRLSNIKLFLTFNRPKSELLR